MKSKSAFTLIELLTVIAIIAILASLLLGTFKGCGAAPYSEGSRVGIVTKSSIRGNVNKSCECELNVLAGIQVVETWKFSATDPVVIQQIEQAKRSGQRVEVVYKQVRIKGYATDSDYIAQRVNFLDDRGNIVQ